MKITDSTLDSGNFDSEILAEVSQIFGLNLERSTLIWKLRETRIEVGFANRCRIASEFPFFNPNIALLFFLEPKSKISLERLDPPPVTWGLIGVDY